MKLLLVFLAIGAALANPIIHEVTSKAPLHRTCKSEHLVKTRDGTHLTTFVYVPEPCDQKYPVVLDRTPYGPTLDQFADTYIPEGFAAVLQNQRGCFTSGGTYNFWKNDSTDAYDTMEWILTQPWANGEIFLSGISADAISLYSDFVIPNPMVHGGYAIWGSGFGHETCYWGGAYRLNPIQNWLTGLGTCENSANIEVEVRQNEAYTDWWASIEANGPYGNNFVNVHSSSIHQSGWWDIFSEPQIDTFTGAQTYGTAQQYLWVVPLGHCTGDEATFKYPQPEPLDAQIMSIQLFKKNFSHPVFKNTDVINFYVFGPVPAYTTETNTIGNYWTSQSQWPKFVSTKYYFGSNGVLSTSLPTSDRAWSYNYDPAHPSPAIGANSLYSNAPCGPRDQAKLENRTDVLAWTSAPVSAPIAFVGKITADLTVISSAVDTDYYVTLTDVYPDTGLSVNIRYGAVKMRWKDGPFTPVNLTPGKTYSASVDLWTTAYILNKGHALRVTITSSRYPEFLVNNNNGCDIIDTSCPTIIANNTILSGPGFGFSSVTLPLVDLSAIPQNTLIH